MAEPRWTEDQCVKLNDYQRHGFMHPFTCGSGKRSNKAHVEAAKAGADPDLGLLVATPGGWVCPACSYRQDWAHAFMFEGRGVDPLAALIAQAAAPEGGS